MTPFMSDHYFLISDTPRCPLLVSIGCPIVNTFYPPAAHNPQLIPTSRNPVPETAANPERIASSLDTPQSPLAGTQP